MTTPSIQNSIFPIWKPQMITSTDVVRKIKNKFDLKKVGHCGTLDPFAEGVLIILSGDKTRSSEEYMKSIKTYRAIVTFGEETDTLDVLGEVIKRDSTSKKEITINDVEKVLPNFIGKIEQRPPAFSAKKINGVRLYKLARMDVFVHLKPVLVEIEEIKIISMLQNQLTIDIKCQKGTYIRQLGSDIAKSLGTLGYLNSLIRTSVGEFNLKNTLSLEDIEDWKYITH